MASNPSSNASSVCPFNLMADLFLMVLSIPVRKGDPFTNITSIHSSSTSCANISWGISNMSVLTIGGLGLVVLPFKVPTSFPNIFSAMSTSLVVTGQFLISLLLIKFFNATTVGHDKV